MRFPCMTEKTEPKEEILSRAASVTIDSLIVLSLGVIGMGLITWRF